LRQTSVLLEEIAKSAFTLFAPRSRISSPNHGT
jgi:hypothetical protein